MAKARIKFRTHVLTSKDKQQLYDYYDNRKKQHEKLTTIFGDAFGTLHFWR